MISSLKRPERGCAWTTASRSASVNSENANAKHVHLDAGGNKRNDGMHELRNAGCRVQRDRGPDRLDATLGDAMAPQEIAGDVPRSFRWRSSRHWRHIAHSHRSRKEDQRAESGMIPSVRHFEGQHGAYCWPP